MTPKGHNISFCGNENILKLDMVMVAQLIFSMNMLKISILSRYEYVCELYLKMFGFFIVYNTTYKSVLGKGGNEERRKEGREGGRKERKKKKEGKKEGRKKEKERKKERKKKKERKEGRKKERKRNKEKDRQTRLWGRQPLRISFNMNRFSHKFKLEEFVIAHI